MDSDIVAVTRHCPNTHQSYILVAFTAFGSPDENSGNYQRDIKPLRFEGNLDEIVLEAKLSHVKMGYDLTYSTSHFVIIIFDSRTDVVMFKKFHDFVKHSTYINGLTEYEVSVKQHIQIRESEIFDKVDSGSPKVTQLNFKNFKPGSIVVVK